LLSQVSKTDFPIEVAPHILIDSHISKSSTLTGEELEPELPLPQYPHYRALKAGTWTVLPRAVQTPEKAEDA